MKSVTFLIPVFNEVKTIEKAILEIIDIKDIDKEIIIIDNFSTDGTIQILKKFINYENITIVFKDKNLGYGDSIKKGFNLAKKDLIYIQYGDLEYPIDGFYKMLKKFNQTNVDVVFGERYEKFSIKRKLAEIINRPQYLGTLITTYMINVFYGAKFNDIIGSKLYRSLKFKNLNINTNNPGFDFELISRIMKKRFLIETVHVPYRARQNSSEKKIKFYHIFNAIYEILRIKIFY